MNIQPRVLLNPGGPTAKGRWRAFVTMGRYGTNASWAGGIYERTYAKENGVWKIRRLEYCSNYSIVEGSLLQAAWDSAFDPQSMKKVIWTPNPASRRTSFF
jgi:hypothetical protein